MAHSYSSPEWLKHAVFYEIYPQSFNDSNGDGIGDIPGITAKLDYIQTLGANALWLNPCFDSPFKDAGYDVRDYKLVAPRYGTNDDLIELFKQAHARNMHVFLDLVPGHTSEEHEWFKRGCEVKPNEYSYRHIWTDSWMAGGAGYPFIGGETDRNATYILNFFKSQPALNYGWAHPQYPWQDTHDSAHARSTADAIADVMRFWLSLGADGFRVDMADSLVKSDDDGKPFTIQTWRYIFDQVRPNFPEAAFVSEWGRPAESMQSGFDMDFYLDWRWDSTPNGYNMLLRNTDTATSREGDMSYFNADSELTIHPFLEQYVPQLRAAEEVGGYFNLITCNHDTPRVAQRLSIAELKIAYATLLSLPGVPFIYYGDEIGMRYHNIPTKEGGFTRTGSRTPMQWDHSKNLGFSSAAPEKLYLPTDPAADAPTVADCMADTESLWTSLRDVIAMRNATPELTANGGFDVVPTPPDSRAFAFHRYAPNGLSVTVAVNPARHEEHIELGSVPVSSEPIFCIGDISLKGTSLVLAPQSFVVIR